MKIWLFAFLLLAGSFFISCDRTTQISSVVREDLFTLDIGRLEDQIAIFRLDGDLGINHAGMVMRDGFFYISDGNGGKVLHFNSYGDLLFMIYNEETNPPPLSLRPLQGGSLVTRWAVSYPLMEPGLITVDSRKHIYVQDRLPNERHSFDLENRAYLDSVILHFDDEGRFIRYLGREGIGGSPFPRINMIYTSEDDDLAVVCLLPTGWNIFWFNTDGILLYQIQLRNEAIPIPQDRDMVIPSLDSIAAAPDQRKLFVKVDYYRYILDDSTNTRTGIEPDSSVIWIMDVESGAWEKNVEVPFYEYSYMDRNRRYSSRVFFSMMGVVREGRIFLYFPVEGGYNLLLLSSDSYADLDHQQRFIRVDDDELQLNVFDLSGEGILSALLVDDWQVKLVWWRTDRI